MNNTFYWINEIGWNCKTIELKHLLKWWYLSLRRDVAYMCIRIRRMSTMRISRYFLYYSWIPKPYISKTLTLGGETPKFMWAPMGKLVPQLLGVVTFAYNLCFRCVIAHCKGILEKYTLCDQTLTLSVV